jgi:hypothetical protein
MLEFDQNILSKYPLKKASLDFKTIERQRKDMFRSRMRCDSKTKCKMAKIHSKMINISAPFLDQLFWQYLCLAKHFRSFVNLRMFWWQYGWWHHLSRLLGNFGSTHHHHCQCVESCIVFTIRETDDSETLMSLSSIPHWWCSKQAPIEGVLLCWSFSLLHVFQSSHVSSLYSCFLILSLVGENYRWSETTSFLLGFPTGSSTNKSL